MSAVDMKHVIATVEFPTELPLADMAARLGAAVGNIVFEKDESGLYEEVPAFIAQESGVSYVLYGLPEEEPVGAYVLELSAQTQLSIREFWVGANPFVRTILNDKKLNSSGYFDFSDELATSLRERGIRHCKAVII
jgi:hypothetical protein